MTSPIDITGMSPEDLQELIAAAKKRAETLKSRPSAFDMRKKLADIAEADGWTLGELFRESRGGAVKKVRSPMTRLPPKYRNPFDPEQTWTGRGQTPRWLKMCIDAGHDASEYLIKREE